MTYWKSEAFKQLQKTWYAQLEAEGFQDIEESVGGEMVLRQNAEHVYRKVDGLGRDSKEAYYQFMSQKVHETVFSSQIDQLILMRHADGAKIRSICEELESMGMRRCRGTIRFKIRSYEMRWGLRSYTPKQLNQKVS